VSTLTEDQSLAEHVLDRTSAELSSRFAGIFGPETVQRYVRESYQALYRTARVKTFVPVLAGRFAADRLTALGQAQGATVKTVPEVLFICVHNAGRSQIAAGLLHAAAGGRVHVRAAGPTPADQINPDAVEAMSEVGIDLGQEFPKPLTNDVVQAADVRRAGRRHRSRPRPPPHRGSTTPRHQRRGAAAALHGRHVRPDHHPRRGWLEDPPDVG